MVFKAIQPLAFQLRNDAQPLTREAITFSFPRHWKQGLLELQSQICNESKNKITIPINSLNRVLRATIPSIISIGKEVTSEWAINEGKPWLFMHETLNPAILIRVVHAWARVQFPADKLPPNMLVNVLKTMQTNDVQWSVTPVDLLSWKTTDTGTAAHTNKAQFVLLPDYVAAAICSAHEGILYGGHELHFRRSSLPAGERGAELVSWPPLEHNKARYSIVLTFSLQTVAFQPYPMLYCHVSMRRWAGPRKTFIRSRASAYITTQLPFIPEVSGWNTHLQVASLERTQHDGQWRTEWRDSLVDILRDLKAPASLIDAQTLSDNPALGMEDWDKAAAIVHSTHMGGHEIGAGITLREQSTIFEQLSEQLAPRFLPIAPFPRVRPKRHQKSKLNPFVEKLKKPDASNLGIKERDQGITDNKNIYTKRCDFIAQAVSPRLDIELYTSTNAVRKALIQGLLQVLGIRVEEQHEETIIAGQLHITVRQSTLGGLGDNLESTTGRNTYDRVTKGIDKRLNEIKSNLTSASHPTLALVEILPKDRYAKQSDPKSALRIGLGRSGRLAQFITTEQSAPNETLEHGTEEHDQDEADKAPLDHRAISAVLDGIRQLGIIGKLPPQPTANKPCTFLGLWMIRRNALRSGEKGFTLPVFVRIDSDNDRPYAYTLGFSDWLPYDQALCELTKRNVISESQSRADYRIFIATELRKIVSANKDTLLLCHAQNLRDTWVWLKNTNILRDALTFGESTNPYAAHEFPGLRIVRIRDTQSHEAPQWFAMEDSWRSAATGLFAMGERVFASTHSKPKQLQKYSHYASKIEEWSSKEHPEITHKPQPSLSTWNPGLYELTVAMLQPEDQGNALSWAGSAHQLRKAAIHFDDALALPLPLHLAKLMDEYILRFDIDGE